MRAARTRSWIAVKYHRIHRTLSRFGPRWAMVPRNERENAFFDVEFNYPAHELSTHFSARLPFNVAVIPRLFPSLCSPGLPHFRADSRVAPVRSASRRSGASTRANAAPADFSVARGCEVFVNGEPSSKETGFREMIFIMLLIRS